MSAAVVVSRLVELEAVIERGLTTFIEVGQALMEIRDQRLYRAEYATFEDYCSKRWLISRPRAYQLMDAAKVAGVLSTTVDTMPGSEAVARELAPLIDAPEAMVEMWQQTVDEHGPEPTAAEVRGVVRRKKKGTSRELSRHPRKPHGEVFDRSLTAMRVHLDSLLDVYADVGSDSRGPEWIATLKEIRAGLAKVTHHLERNAEADE